MFAWQMVEAKIFDLHKGPRRPEREEVFFNH